MVSYKAMHDQNYLHDITDINTFCDWLSGTTMTSVYDSVHRNTISIGLLSSIVLVNQSQRLFISVRGDPIFGLFGGTAKQRQWTTI